MQRRNLTSVVALMLLLVLLPFSVTVSAIGTEAQPAAPTPPVCNKLYVGAEAGLMHCNNETQAGYTIFSATADENIYMIDERGELRHQWVSTHPNGSGYGLDVGVNGSILHVVNDLPLEDGPLLMDAGGAATHIEILDANSNLMWQITEYAHYYRLHHDATFLPNGNVLAIAWEYIDETTARSMGRQESLLTSDGLWPDVVIEYAPTESGGAEIVWMWRASDHLVQDQDQMLPTFGYPNEHPEKIDINAVGPNARADDADWMHCNSIDYDEVHKHILLSCRHTEELYIINHNLTWEQSNGSSGDLLYRWGNPLNYGLGSSADHYTVVQHDAHFIPAGYPYAGSISYFSNDVSGPSSIGIITPKRMGNSFVLNSTTGMHEPGRPTVEFTLPSGWGPRFQSGATLMPNGQFMVSHSLRGKLGQIGNDSQIDWEYNLPLNPGGQIASRTQRTFPPVYFKAEWLEVGDLRLQNLALPRLGVIESYEDVCLDGGDDVLWDWNGDGCIEDDDQDGVTNDQDWCTDTALDLTVDEFGCELQEEMFLGCTDPTAINYNPQAEIDDGTCEYEEPDVVGCMDSEASNFDSKATVHDQSLCEYPPPPVEGCTDSSAINFNQDATIDDGSCTYPTPPTEGCHDETASNYDPSTDVHNASLCEYPVIEPPPPVEGCTDLEALNYDPTSELDDGSCLYPQEEEEPVVEEEIVVVVEPTCEERGDCPIEPQTTPMQDQVEGELLLAIGLGAVVVGLLFVFTVQVSRRQFDDED